MIDLHCHSHYSDGELSPAQLLQKAITHNLTCLSLTDHDTVAGYAELQQAALDRPITLVQGIEFSVRWKKYTIHILGYGMQATEVLQSLIARQSASREVRAKEIAACLQRLGVVDAYEKACKLAGHSRVGRPHFAQLLVDEGKTKDRQAAFRQYLAEGRLAYVPTPWISLEEAVQGIVTSGGQAVVAHPSKYKLTRTKLHALVADFKEAGGCGIEVVSGEMMVSQIVEMAAVCKRFHLLASSGSDYHGDSVSRIALGKQRQLPESCTPIWQDWPGVH